MESLEEALGRLGMHTETACGTAYMARTGLCAAAGMPEVQYPAYRISSFTPPFEAPMDGDSSRDRKKRTSKRPISCLELPFENE